MKTLRNRIESNGRFLPHRLTTNLDHKSPQSRPQIFPIHPTVCFKVGRFTLTQSSWTASTRGRSRKWMSGHAAIALVLLRDRGQFATLTICPLGEPIPPSQGESPFPVDFYLSWMSTNPLDEPTPIVLRCRIGLNLPGQGRTKKPHQVRTFKLSPDPAFTEKLSIQLEPSPPKS